MRQNLIFDVGLHLGEDSEFYLRRIAEELAAERRRITHGVITEQDQRF